MPICRVLLYVSLFIYYLFEILKVFEIFSEWMFYVDTGYYNMYILTIK